MTGYPMSSGNPNGFRVPFPPGWVGLTEAARALRISRWSLRNGIKKGEITAYRIFLVGSRKFYGFRKEDLCL